MNFEIFLFWFLCYDFASSFDWNDIQLYEKHLPMYFNNNPALKSMCEGSTNCPFKEYLNEDSCWGYEENCLSNHSYSQPKCPGHHKGWVNSKEEQLKTFFDQGDFGYVKQHRDQLKIYCKGNGTKSESMLECSDHLQFCKGQNIYIDFRDLVKRDKPVRYHMDVLKEGLIGGNCRLNTKLMKDNADLISPLQSWGPEMRYFSEIKKPLHGKSSSCDIWIKKPAIITKIDASVSMYHHFCDFFNLYASQHVNNSDSYAFTSDTQVLIWETYPYGSNFEIAWKPFTRNPIWNLDKVAGKRVCFQNVVFPLLPRMIFGLYYNTPIIWGCENSGLFHAFSHHMIHRLAVKKRKKTEQEIHVTFLSRRTKHRRVLNEQELLKALEDDGGFIVRQVTFGHEEPFINQLNQDQWTDILIGIHGSGLTHLLFLPDWAVVIELYDCGDPNCYQDLARLRGVQYLTFDNKSKIYPEDEGHHPDLRVHEKFTNYSFDTDEFLLLVKRASKMVKQQKEWKRLLKRPTRKEEEL